MPWSSMLVTQSMCGSCFFSTARNAVCMVSLVLGPLDVALAHVAQRSGQEAAGAAGRVEQGLAGPGVEAVDHEGGDGPGRVVLARIARRLQVVQDLFVDIAKMLAFAQVVEIDLGDLVDHLPHQLAGFHVVVGILEHIAHDATAGAGAAGHLQRFQRGKQVVVDEGEQIFPSDAFGVRRPGAPLVARGDRRGVARLQSILVPGPDRR